MAVTIEVEALDLTAYFKDGSLTVTKQGATEQVQFDLLDRDDSSSSALRVSVGDRVRLLHNADLLGGGPIVRVEDRRLTDNDTGTITRVTVRDWMFLAEQIIIEDRYFPSQPAFDLFDDLVQTYLDAKGVTNIGTLTGGPVLPEMYIKGETLLSVFLQIEDQLRIQEEERYAVRINADKEIALIEPGTLIGPVTLSPANVVDGQNGLTWTQDSVLQANRLFLTTGVPEAGAGPVTHSETRFGDGTLQVFPVNVIPNRSLVGVVDNTGGYSGGDTSMVLKDLTPGMVIVAGNSFTSLDHSGITYVVGGDVTVDEDGKATVGFSPGLASALPEEAPVTFSNETGISLTVGGTPTDLFGSPWVWDRIQQAVVDPTTPVGSGDEVVVSHRVTFPAVVRVWETGGPSVQDSVGNFNYASVVDGTAENDEHHTDLSFAADYARKLLLRRTAQPKVVRCATFEPGWYPFLTATVSWSARLLSGEYLVDTVRISQRGIDPNATTLELLYELEMTEDDGVRVPDIEYQRRQQHPARGVRWGGIADPASPVKLFDVSTPSGTTSQSITGAGDTPRALFAMSGVLAKGTTAAAAQVSIGAYGPKASSSGNMLQTSTLYRTVDNAATTDGRWGSDSSAIIYNIAQAGGFGDEQYLVVSSVDADGATFSPSFGTGSGEAAAVMTFPEDTFSHASVGLTQLRTSAGTTDVDCRDFAGSTFEPDAVLFWASGFVNTSEVQVPVTDSAQPWFGVAVNGGFQGCVSGFDEVGAAAADSYQYISDAAAIRPLDDAAALYCDASVSFLSTGFRLTYAAGAPVAAVFRWLALKGGVWTAGVAQAPTSPGDVALDVSGMWPSAVIAAGIAGTSLNSVLNGMGLTWGLASRDPDNHYTVWNCSVDGADPSQCDKAVQDALLYWGTDNAPGTPRAVCSVSEWAEDEITLDFSTASTAFRFLWLAVGTTP